MTKKIPRGLAFECKAELCDGSHEGGNSVAAIWSALISYKLKGNDLATGVRSLQSFITDQLNRYPSVLNQSSMAPNKAAQQCDCGHKRWGNRPIRTQ